MVASGPTAITPHKKIILPTLWVECASDAELFEAHNLRENIIAYLPRQMEHPIYEPILEDDVVKAMKVYGPLNGLRKANKLLMDGIRSVEAMTLDPYNCGYEPPMWRKILLWLARKRLELPQQVLVFYVFGGKRSGKTDLGGKRSAQHLAAFERPTAVGQYKAWVWNMHQTEQRSKGTGQKRVYHYLPIEWKRKYGKDEGGKLNYADGQGFTNNSFIIDGKFCEFLYFGMDEKNLQGSELTFAQSDELVPPGTVAILNERLTTRAATAGSETHQRKIKEALRILETTKEPLPAHLIAALHLGVHLITFTPVEGFTQVAAHALNGAITIEEEDAEALPILGPADAEGNKPVLGYEKAPRVQQCKRQNEMIFYLWTKDNKWGGYEALLDLSKGQGGDAIKINLYGWVQKSWQGAYPRYSSNRHVVKWSQVPRNLTVYLRVDLGKAKPWCMLWIGHAPDGRRYILNEWPREGDYIPSIGDPGPWATVSVTDKQDGDAGPAQRPCPFGYNDYLKEIERVERQLGAWAQGHDNPFILSARELENYEPIHVEANSMDSRLGHSPNAREGGTTTLIEEINELLHKQGSYRYFEPAPGEQLSQGDIMINNVLADVEGMLPHAPGLFVLEHCYGTRFMLENYTGNDGNKGACKDWRDALVFDLCDDGACWVDPRRDRVSFGGYKD